MIGPARDQIEIELNMVVGDPLRNNLVSGYYGAVVSRYFDRGRGNLHTYAYTDPLRMYALIERTPQTISIWSDSVYTQLLKGGHC